MVYELRRDDSWNLSGAFGTQDEALAALRAALDAGQVDLVRGCTLALVDRALIAHVYRARGGLSAGRPALMPYMLDADWTIQASANRAPAADAVRRIGPADLAISWATVGEVYEGARRRRLISALPAARPAPCG